MLRELKAQWIKAINTRMTSDRITATKIKRDKPFIKLVDATWKNTLRKKGISHQEWLFHQEVFSG